MAKITAKLRRRVRLYRARKQEDTSPCFSDFIKNSWSSISLKKMSLVKKCFIVIAIGLFMSVDQLNFMTLTAQADFSIDSETIDEDIFVEKPLITQSEVESEIIQYIVQPGDTVSSLSEKFHITGSTITNANNLSRNASLDVGQKLKILPVTGLLHTVKSGDSISKIAGTYSVPQELIRYQNDIDSDKALNVGMEIIVPNGIPPQVTPRSSSTPSKKGSAPSGGRQDAPDSTAPETGGTFVWPASCRVITRGFNPKIPHWGLDCANSQGTPIYAADNGVVIKASAGTWGGGYGNHVIIDHGNGIKTIYAHLYSVGVTEGQRVDRGEGIGLMGTTGRSTGPHLHFEVTVNGKKTNPMKYL